MRVLSKRGIALLGAIGLAATLSACGADEQDTAASTASSTPAATSAPAETPSQEATAETEADAQTVESIDAMVAALQKKNYACKDWQQTDEVAEAQASGTCNGEDTVMVFADNAGVQAMTTKLDGEGRGYVYGENWVVADTVTPTFVRNALGGTAVKAGAAS